MSQQKMTEIFQRKKLTTVWHLNHSASVIS